MKVVFEWIRDILIAVAIALVILYFIKPIIIQQESMQPNFYEGDYVITARQHYKLFSQPKHGDVIVFESQLLDEKGNKKNLIKRIIGLPGDEIEIMDGYVYRNGEKIDEPYVKEEGLSGEMIKVQVPEKSFFVMGDNRGVSRDSRDPDVGCIKEDTLVGKVVIRLFPFNKIKTF